MSIEQLHVAITRIEKDPLAEISGKYADKLQILALYEIALQLAVANKIATISKE